MGDRFQFTGTSTEFFAQKFDFSFEVFSDKLPHEYLGCVVSVSGGGGGVGFEFFLDLSYAFDVVIQTGIFFEVDFPHVDKL